MVDKTHDWELNKQIIIAATLKIYDTLNLTR